MTRYSTSASETQKRRSLLQRMTVVHILFLLLLLIIIARLIELQIVNGRAHRQTVLNHFRDVELPAKRGEILSVNSKTGELNILATNTTLDLVYVDPFVANPLKKPSDATTVAETLADVLLTPEFHKACETGSELCPRELIPFYASAFDPLTQYILLHTGALLEPIPTGVLPPKLLKLPDFAEARRLFARDIERRISRTRVEFVPLKYGATKMQMAAVAELGIPGITVDREEDLLYANPQEINQSIINAAARKLGPILEIEPAQVAEMLRTRALRYVPIMRRLPPELSLKIKQVQLASLKTAIEERKKNKNATESLQHPLRSIAIIQEHWRTYPDTTIASHVIGFVNANNVPQYGIERTFNPQLRGQPGVSLSDIQGGPIPTTNQTITNPKDGDTIVLTIDRAIQKEVESQLEEAVRRYKAESGQAIVMEPRTGRILAMVNAPLFNSNDYAHVYEKQVISVDADQQRKIVVELTHPKTNALILKNHTIAQVFTASGRILLSEKTRKALDELEKLYDLHDLARYYLFITPTIRREIFPTAKPDMWLKFKNDIGVGAYLNRNAQEIYEPGSVMKPITMAIAIDQGEVRPGDTYYDTGPVKVDEYVIANALDKYYGTVTMTNCLEYSINTCMTSVSEKLGARLFHRELERFGFGKITNVELEDELAGSIRRWQDFLSRSVLATASFGQGISATPLQVVTAWAVLANGGKLVKPTIVDSIIHNDKTVDRMQPVVIDQVIRPQTAETITAMLVSSTEHGYANVARIDGYKMATKTGTSQIAKPGGGWESGSGSTIATFAGYAPARDPRFVILIKIDRPKNTVFGVVAAAPVYKNIAQFLFKYYGIPPDGQR